MKRDSQRGAVSVFLAIILIPCIVISSVYVDMSRVRLSKGLATSSADLALNSLLTHYDKDLSQIYGMMASCQNIEEFYMESAQMFLDALYSQGLEEDDIDSLVSMYGSVVGDDTVYDLLSMDVKTSTSDMVSAVEGASLGESSLMIKDQIVDFMKYRGPIEILTGIVERIKGSNVTELIEAEKNEPLVEDKEEYAEAAGELAEACFDTYEYIKKYVDKTVTNTELQHLCNKLTEYRELYREITKAFVINFSNTSGLSKFIRPTYNINAYKSSYKKSSKDVYSRKETIDDVVHYYVDGNDIKSNDGKKGIIPELENNITAFNTAKTNLINAVSSYIDTTTGTGADQTNEIQWWVKVNNAINSGNNSHIQKLKSAAEKMLKSYAKMLAMLECEDGNNVPATWREDCETLKSKVSSICNTYLKAGVKNNNDKYLKLVNRLETISSNNINNIDPNKFKLSNGKTISTTVSEIKTALENETTDLKACIEYLDIAIDGDFLKGIKSLDGLEECVKEYQTKFEDWENTADKTDTTMGGEDREEIQTHKDEYAEITVESIRELKSRLVNIRSVLVEVQDAVDSLKYGSKKLLDIDSYNTAYNAVKGRIDKNRIQMKNSQLNSYAEEVFKSVFVPYASDSNTAIYMLEHKNDPNYNPDLTVSKPALYQHWEKQYKAKEDKIKQAKNEMKQAEKDAEEAEKAKDKTRWGHISKTNIYGGSYTAADFPSGLDGNLPFKLGDSFIQNICNLVESFTSGSFSNIRDSLYATEYVMDMFSYATFDAEGKYILYRDTNKDATIGDNPSYASVEGDGKGKWSSTLITDKYNKTLTNKMINSANNVAYAAEIEYILYGNTNEKSVKQAYADIYGIRYALNLISGFANFWSKAKNNDTARAIDNISMAISGASQGVIPAPLIKTVFIALLTALETGKDLDRLQNGLPVEMYKKDIDWRYSINSNKSTNADNSKDNKNGLFYSDYLYIFLYLGFESNSASEMYYRVGDVIQANMRKATGDSSYTLKKSQMYFKIDATIKVNPLMLTLPYALPYSNNPYDQENWCTFKIVEKRGYS